MFKLYSLLQHKVTQAESIYKKKTKFFKHRYFKIYFAWKLGCCFHACIVSSRQAWQQKAVEYISMVAPFPRIMFFLVCRLLFNITFDGFWKSFQNLELSKKSKENFSKINWKVSVFESYLKRKDYKG